MGLLSFDITDKQLKIVRGVQAGAKVRIAGTIIIDINDGLIINGFIQDIPKLASIIAEKFREKRIAEKEAVVSISSSQIVFKELSIPQAKSTQLKTIVQNQIQQNMQVTDEYSVAYTIVGEEEVSGSKMYKILASACPKTIVDDFRKLFGMLGIALKNFSASCSCIARVVLADNKNRDKMPLLVIQIDENFLNINLFEKNQLAFSRHVSIDKDDYDGDDYLIQALNDNVFRMIQFNRSRGGSGIKDIIFYGDVQDYIKLTMAIEQQDVKTHILAVPNQVVGYEKIEFASFANAVGAMFKRKKETESINFLGVEPSFSFSKSNSSFAKTIGFVSVACVALVAAVFFSLEIKDKSIEKDCDEIQTYIDNNQSKLEKISKEKIILGKLEAYNNSAKNATAALDSTPLINSEVFDKIRSCSGTQATIKDIDYTTGTLKVTFTTADKKFPAALVEKLIDLKYFANVSYTGFAKEEVEGSSTFNFEITFNQKAGVTND